MNLPVKPLFNEKHRLLYIANPKCGEYIVLWMRWFESELIISIVVIDGGKNR